MSCGKLSLFMLISSMFREQADLLQIVVVIFLYRVGAHPTKVRAQINTKNKCCGG